MIGRFSRSVRAQIASAEQKRLYNRGLFTRVARDYDSVTRVMSLFRDSAWKRRMVAMLPNLQAPCCLDLACGTGDVTLLLGNRFPAGTVIGADLTHAMLSVATARNSRENIHFQAADMLCLPFANGSTDIVTGSYALRNAPDLSMALGEIRRVLRPGGYAAFLDFARPANPHLFEFHRRVLLYWCGAWSIAMHGCPEHTYISESLRLFPSRPALRQMLENSGLRIVQRHSPMLGIMDLILCQAT